MNRERLPDRRSAETLALEFAGLRYTVTIGRFPGDGRLGEVFVANHKRGNAADVVVRDAGIPRLGVSKSSTVSTGCVPVRQSS
jgi:hypothetical protein